MSTNRENVHVIETHIDTEYNLATHILAIEKRLWV